MTSYDGDYTDDRVVFVIFTDDHAHIAILDFILT